MKTLHYSILINAPREKVWDTMLGKETYTQWTEPFHPGSMYRGEWKEGSKMLFVGPMEDGSEMGMVSRIAEVRPNEFVSIQHLGIFANGVEDTESEEARKWSPAFENYTFNEKDGGTEVLVDVDMAEEYADMMAEQWPKALEKLKEIAEAQ